MEKMISVIIPVYNVEKYIEKCLKSVVNQTYKNLEIIIVNDGTKDNSMDIVEKYKDDRFVIINQENKGLSSARNAGLDVATGEYIKFMDSDDYMSLTWIEESVNEIEKDISLSGVINSNVIHRYDSFDKLYSGDYGLLITNKDERLPNVWGIWTCLYKREVIENNNIRFFEGLNIEDEGFQICMLPFIDKVKLFYGKSIHYYIQRDDSIMSNYRDNILHEDYISILENCAYFYKEKGISLDRINWNSLFTFLKNQKNMKEYLIKSKEMLSKFNIDINGYIDESIKSKYYDVLGTNKTYPLISIITPSYNSEKFLPLYLGCLERQRYKNFEVIFVDDGSTDNTKEIINSINSDLNLKYYYKKNGGVSSARNYGLKHAKGEFIFFLDSDDFISENFLERLIEPMIENKDIDITYCDNIIIKTMQGEFIGKIKRDNMSSLIDPKKDYFISPIGLGSSLIRANKVLDNNIFFDESVKRQEDMLFFNILLPYLNKLKFVNSCSFFYNKIKVLNISKKEFKNNLENIKRKIEKYYKKHNITSISIYKEVIKLLNI